VVGAAAVEALKLKKQKLVTLFVLLFIWQQNDC